ncbi:MAG: hypothetical protein RLZZ59_295 [Pseudomonadota bacterium]
MRKPCKTASTNISLELVGNTSKKLVPAGHEMIHKILTKAAALKDEVVVVKIPSEIINNDYLLNQFLRNMMMLHSSGVRLVMVHDYDVVDHIADLFGFDVKAAKQNQMSDFKSSKIVEMMLSGYINRKIVSMLCDMGCETLGISGKDCNTIRATQKVSKISSDNLINIGFVAEPTMINPEILLGFMDSDVALVVSPIASCDNGSTCVIDTNITAAIIAAALSAKYLILPSKNPNIDGAGIVFTDMDKMYMRQMKLDPKSSESFKAILDTAISAIDNYVEYVCVLDSANPENIVEQIFMEKHK